MNFYPSITFQLLHDSLNFAANYVNISEQDRKIILKSKNILLYSEESPWVKKGENDMFDVTMGSWDGAEVCELVGFYLL